jgi:peptidoglycan/xylan/chitin deacetylase (PgdA/CDA1 family)
VLLLLVTACTTQASTSGSPSASATGVDPALPRPSLTPAVLLPGQISMLALTPVGASTAVPTPLATFAAGTAAKTVPILMYHQIRDLPPTANLEDLTWTISPASLDAQLGYLADKGYSTISLDQLLDGFGGKTALPPKAVVITFDDGWKTQYTNAFPLLKKHKQTATFYVVSTYMGYGAYFDWTMTEELKNAGMTIGGHTLDHADLTKKSATDMDHELRDSKAALEQHLGVTINHFAYPFGAYNDAVVSALKRAGYRSATTIDPVLVKNPVSAYLLPRIRVSYKEALADFIKKLP